MHGFQERPHYEPPELDSILERAVTGFLKKYATTDFPITIDDVTTLIEQDVSDLDQYAETSVRGHIKAIEVL